MRSSRPQTLRIALACALSTGWACGSSEVQFVQLPDHSTETTLLAYRSEDAAPFTLHVIGQAGTPGDEISSESEVFALHYAQTAAELGLEPGGLRRCGLLYPLHVDHLEGLRFGAFVGQLPEALRRTLLENPERCSPCRPLNMRSSSFGELGTLKAGAWLASGPVVSHLGGGFRRVDEQSSVPISGCELEHPSVQISAMLAIGPNRYWIGSESGELLRVNFDEHATSCTVETSTRAPPGANSAFLALEPDPFDSDPEAFFALLADGRLIRRTQGHWQDAIELPLHPLDLAEGGTRIGEILVREEGRGLAITGSDQIFWWGPGGIERVDDVELPYNQFTEDGGQRVTSLVVDPDPAGDRLLAGASQGLVFERDAATGGWNPHLRLPIRKEVRGFQAFADRWLLIIEQGDLVVWHRETGVCEAPMRMPLATNSGFCKHVAREGTRLAVFDAIGDVTRPTGVVWIEED